MGTSNITILDGGMGTMLQAAGLPMGQLPEVWNITNPNTVAEIQRKYVEAGSRVIYANTFGANRHKVETSGYTPAELIAGGIQAARRPGRKGGAGRGPHRSAAGAIGHHVL